MGRKGNLAKFETNIISETGDATPTRIGEHVCYINLYWHDSPIIAKLSGYYLKPSF